MKRRDLCAVLAALALLVAASLACSAPGSGKPTVSISEPEDGSEILLGEMVEVAFHAEDADAVVWVQLVVDGMGAVSTAESPIEGGQTPLEGALRWTPTEAGTYKLVVLAQNAAGASSDPTSITIDVVDGQASGATRTPKATTEATGAVTKGAMVEGTTARVTSAPPTRRATETTRPSTREPTREPTKRPTDEPTATPSRTPEPTDTLLPPPEIVDYRASVYTVGPNECTTLAWQTLNANDVDLNTEAVSASGDRTICYADLSDGLNAFTLYASNGEQTAMQSIQITRQSAMRLSAPFVPNLSGTVSDNGNMLSAVSPGDDGVEDNYIGFLSFDITSLPGDAGIRSAMLDLGPCTVSGDPFNDLGGQLYVTYLYFGDLEAADYSATGGEYVASVYGCPAGQIDITASLDAHKTYAYYQITLSWPVHADFAGDIDDVTYTAPTLEIEYVP